jgi:lipoic acid synthetase
VKESDPQLFTKSGLMLGLGETLWEVHALMDDLRDANVDFVTIGQYLRPSPRHARVERYWTPDEFAALGRRAADKGFRMVSSSPMTRSSYHADEGFRQLLARREEAPPSL